MFFQGWVFSQLPMFCLLPNLNESQHLLFSIKFVLYISKMGEKNNIYVIKYAQHVVNDPIVYLNKDQNGFCLGTKEEAEKNGWVTMQDVRKQF